VAALAAVAAAGAAGPRVRTISFRSPFASCVRGGQPSPGLFVGAEVEPAIAANPRDPRNLIAVYQADRWTDGAARGIAASYSRDGGATWREVPLPFSACAPRGPRSFPRASDPWISIDARGRAYALALGRGIAVATSADGGARWSRPFVLATNSGRYLMDKCTITADPARAGVAYAVWERYLLRGNAPPIESDTMLAITRDGGRSWSAPRSILRHTRAAGPLSSVVVRDPRRRRLFHLVEWQAGGVPGPDPAHETLLEVQVSRDDGRSWSAPWLIARVRTVGGNLRDPTTRRVIRSSVASFALDARSGALYAAWTDSRFTGGATDQVVLSRSADGGRTWSPPARVDGSSRRIGIIPSVAAAAGRVVVTYFAPGGSRPGLRSPFAYRLAVSPDGGRTFRASGLGAAFDLAQAPELAGDPALLVPPGLFLGDYMGLVPSKPGFVTAFVTTNPSAGNRTDVRFARLG
jgi:hypothetical protein